jgi:hypothetical protein
MNITKDDLITGALSIYAIYVSYCLVKTNNELNETKLMYEMVKKTEDIQNKMSNEFHVLRQELHKLQVDTNIILQLHQYKDPIDEEEDDDYHDDPELLEINNLVDDISRSRSHSLSSVVKTLFG